jgi:hypothetical protein
MFQNVDPSLTTQLNRPTVKYLSNYNLAIFAMFLRRFGHLCVVCWYPLTRVLPIGRIQSETHLRRH